MPSLDVNLPLFSQCTQRFQRLGLVSQPWVSGHSGRTFHQTFQTKYESQSLTLSILDDFSMHYVRVAQFVL